MYRLRNYRLPKLGVNPFEGPTEQKRELDQWIKTFSHAKPLWEQPGTLIELQEQVRAMNPGHGDDALLDHLKTCLKIPGILRRDRVAVIGNIQYSYGLSLDWTLRFPNGRILQTADRGQVFWESALGLSVESLRAWKPVQLDELEVEPELLSGLNFASLSQTPEHD